MLDKEALARVLASALGDDFNLAFESKRDWTAARGGNPFRDINMPYKGDYLHAVDALLSAAKAKGYAIVPVVPTRRMLFDALDAAPLGPVKFENGMSVRSTISSDECTAIYTAMLLAAGDEG